MNINQVIFSIIVPCYNSEKYIERTLNSLINQTFKDIEIIVVDDGSTDESVKICKEILKNSNSKYKIISQVNQGVSEARNTGLKNSTGKYVYMIDSDDFIDSEFLKSIYSRLENDNLDMIFCGYDKVKEDESICFSYNKSYEYFEDIRDGNRVLKMVFNNKVHLWTGSTVYRKEMLSKFKIKYHRRCSNGEDQEFWMKALLHSERVGCINKILAHYLQRDNSITHNPSLKRFSVLGSVLRLKKYIELNGMNEEFLRYLKFNKFQKEFICNLTEIARESKTIDKIEPIISNKKFNKILKKYRISSISKWEIRVWLRIKLYLINPYIYVKLLSKYI